MVVFPKARVRIYLSGNIPRNQDLVSATITDNNKYLISVDFRNILPRVNSMAINPEEYLSTSVLPYTISMHGLVDTVQTQFILTVTGIRVITGSKELSRIQIDAFVENTGGDNFRLDLINALVIDNQGTKCVENTLGNNQYSNHAGWAIIPGGKVDYSWYVACGSDRALGDIGDLLVILFADFAQNVTYSDVLYIDIY